MKEITNGHPPIGTGLPASKPNTPRDPRRRFASMWSGAVSVAPASVLPNRTDEFYNTEEEALFAIADALHEEYSAVVEFGLLVQIDDAFLASYYDVMVPPLSMEDYRKWAALRVDALNHALRGIPPSDAAITSAGEAGMDLTPTMSR